MADERDFDLGLPHPRPFDSGKEEPRKPKTLSAKVRLAMALKAQNKLNDIVVGSSELEGT